MKNLVFFTTYSGGQYVYDKPSSTVIPLNDILTEIINYYFNESNDIDQIQTALLAKYSFLEVMSSIKFFQRWVKKFNGFTLTNLPLVRVQISDDKILKDIFNQGITCQLILNITEDCNFRCKYCFFSECYDYTRNRTSSHMTYEIAVKAIDYYFTLLKDVKQKIPNKIARLNFYGGEPLLRHVMITELVEYAKKNSPVPIEFYITTNGYLLDEEKIDFLVENQFRIAISLDGDKKNHDTNRVLSNEIGTFDKVLSNIMLLQEKYPSYTKIGIISVYDYNTNLVNNVKFFSQTKLPPILQLNMVLTNNTRYYDGVDDDVIKKQEEIYSNLYSEYIEKKIKNDDMSDYMRLMFESNFIEILLRERQLDNKYYFLPYTGTCMPGTKISVRGDGAIDICEKINQMYPVGSVDTGLDYKKIMNIINDYNAITDNCLDCIASNSCPMCFALALGNGNFNLPPNFCINKVNHFVNGLKILYTILEKNSLAFDNYLENYRDKVIFNI